MPLGVGFPFIEPPPPSGGGGGGHTPVYKTVVLTTSSTSPWHVPADWDATHNTIQCIGGGGKTGGGGTYGGNGGDYSSRNALAWVAGHTVPFHVGSGVDSLASPTAAFTSPNTFIGNATIGVSAAFGLNGSSGPVSQPAVEPSGVGIDFAGGGGTPYCGGGAGGPNGYGLSGSVGTVGGAGDNGRGGAGGIYARNGGNGTEIYNTGGVYYGSGGGSGGSYLDANYSGGNYGGGGGIAGGPGIIIITYLGYT